MTHRIKLGELLVRAGVLDDTKLQAALAEQRRWGGRLGKILVSMGLMSEDLLVKALSKQLGIPRADLANVRIPPELAEKLDSDFLHEHVVCPVGFDAQRRLLTLAMADPTQVGPLDAVRFKTGLRVEPLIAGESQIARAIDALHGGTEAVPGLERTSQRPVDFGRSAAPWPGPPQPLPGSSASIGDFGPTLGPSTPRADAVSAPYPFPSSMPSMSARPTTLSAGTPGGPAPTNAPTNASMNASVNAPMSVPLNGPVDVLRTLEVAQAQQQRAMRAMLELLIEKGVFTREAYLTALSRY